MFRNTFQSGVVSILSAYGSDPFQLWDICAEQKHDGPEECDGRIRRIEANDDDDCLFSTEEEAGEGDADRASGPTIEIFGMRLSQNYITCPPIPIQPSAKTPRPSSLGITLPFLYITVRVPPRSDFSFEVTILDDGGTARRFRASTFKSTTAIRPDICTFPLRLESRRRRPTRDALLLPVAKKRKVASESNSRGDDSGHYGPGIHDVGNYDDDCDDNDDGDCYDGDGDGEVSCWNRLCVPLAEYTRRAYGTGYVETARVQIHANCRLKRVYFAEKEMDEDDELPEEFRMYSRPPPR